jgi:dTDP-4-amino-4,6-dideoxygalactose transaminase
VSELQAAYLLAQLENADLINSNRLEIWEQYHSELMNIDNLEIQKNSEHCNHNGHMYYIKLENKNRRSEMIKYLLNRGIMAVFHYVPLHSSPIGSRICRFKGEDRFTTKESERILRLPMWFNLSKKNVNYITTSIASF